MREHVAVNTRFEKVRSLRLQYLQTWHIIVSHLFVGFSINCFKTPFEKKRRVLLASVKQGFSKIIVVANIASSV